MGSTDVWLRALDLLWLSVAAANSPPNPLPSPSLKLGTQTLGGSCWCLLHLHGQNDPTSPSGQLQQFEACSPWSASLLPP